MWRDVNLVGGAEEDYDSQPQRCPPPRSRLARKYLGDYTFPLA